jgi:hypothetical protein
MTDDLLYVFPKEECESFVNSLEEAESAADEVKYNFYNTKKSAKQFCELVDVRSRLCTMEDKDRITSLSERIAALEAALA